jgi:hypothetical protein
LPAFSDIDGDEFLVVFDQLLFLAEKKGAVVELDDRSFDGTGGGIRGRRVPAIDGLIFVRCR